MPINKCESDGKPGYKYGDSGQCYVYTDGDEPSRKKALAAARKQGLAAGGGKPAEKGALKLNSAEPPETTTIEGVEILAEGVKVKGTLEYAGASEPIEESYDGERLQRIAKASNAASDLKAPLKIGHSKEQQLLRNSGLASDEEPAAGWLTNFRVSGDKLVADVKGVPKKLASLATTAFRTRSAEIGSWHDQENDEDYPEVVRGLALLGTTLPAFQTLDDLVALYSGETGQTARLIEADEPLDDPTVSKIAAFAAPEILWDSEQGAQDVMDDLRMALNPDPAVPGRYWVMDVMIGQGGGRALVSDYGSDSSDAWVVPFNFDADGDPVPADQSLWVAAQQAWVKASESAAASYTETATSAGRLATTTSAPDVSFSSAGGTEGTRAGDTSSSVADENDKPDGEETQVEITAEEAKGLKRLLSIFKVSGGDEDGEEKPSIEVAPEAVKAFAAAAGIPDETDPAKILEAMRASTEEPKLPEGFVAFAAEEKEKLEKMASEGAEAKKMLDEERKQTLLRTYARAAKIAPADFEHYGKLYDLDPELAKATLDKLPVRDDLVQMFGSTESAELLEVYNIDRDEISEEQYAAFCAASGTPYVRVGGGEE